MCLLGQVTFVVEDMWVKSGTKVPRGKLVDRPRYLCETVRGSCIGQVSDDIIVEGDEVMRGLRGETVISPSLSVSRHQW